MASERQCLKRFNLAHHSCSTSTPESEKDSIQFFGDHSLTSRSSISPYNHYFPLCYECSRSVDGEVTKAREDLNRDISNLQYFLEKFTDLPTPRLQDLEKVIFLLKRINILNTSFSKSLKLSEECDALKKEILREENIARELGSTITALDESSTKFEELEVFSLLKS